MGLGLGPMSACEDLELPVSQPACVCPSVSLPVFARQSACLSLPACLSCLHVCQSVYTRDRWTQVLSICLATDRSQTNKLAENVSLHGCLEDNYFPGFRRKWGMFALCLKGDIYLSERRRKRGLSMCLRAFRCEVSPVCNNKCRELCQCLLL